MTRGVLRSLGERISDQARQQALEFERARRAAARQGRWAMRSSLRN